MSTLVIWVAAGRRGDKNLGVGFCVAIQRFFAALRMTTVLGSDSAAYALNPGLNIETWGTRQTQN